MTKTFKELLAWQNAYQYCLYVHEVSSKFPDFEKYGLRSQFTRSAVTIIANIAEEYGKQASLTNCASLILHKGVLTNAVATTNWQRI